MEQGTDCDELYGRRASDFSPTRTGAQKSRLCQMGGLDKRTGVAKLGVYIVTEGDFRDHPKVADGASEFLR
jgi:hypothetical protein